MHACNLLDLLALADRLCLQRLINLAEARIIIDLVTVEETGTNITEEVLSLLEPAKVHIQM